MYEVVPTQEKSIKRSFTLQNSDIDMAGIYKVVVGEKALFEINKKLNGEQTLLFNGAFAHTQTFSVERIYVQDGQQGNFFEAFILTMERNAVFISENLGKRKDIFTNYSDLREKVYENFRFGEYHNLFKYRQ